MQFRHWLESESEIEKLQRLPIETLDIMAFGFKDDSILLLDPNILHIRYDTDIENAEHDMRRSGKTPKQWARGVSLKTPVDVDFHEGIFVLQDGHHRYLAAKTLGKKLPCKIDIKDNPVLAIMKKRGLAS